MPWEAWVLFSLFGLGSLLTVGFVGRPRGPITPSTAVASLVVAALYALLVWRLA